MKSFRKYDSAHAANSAEIIKCFLIEIEIMIQSGANGKCLQQHSAENQVQIHRNNTHKMCNAMRVSERL